MVKSMAIQSPGCKLEGFNRVLSPEVGVILNLKEEQMERQERKMPCIAAFLTCSGEWGGTSNDAREERWGFPRAPMCAKEELQY